MERLAWAGCRFQMLNSLNSSIEKRLVKKVFNTYHYKPNRYEENILSFKLEKLFK